MSGNPATSPRRRLSRGADLDLIGGDWLLPAGADANYLRAYTATITGGWQGGVTATVTRSVMARIAFDQLAIYADTDSESDRLLFRGAECFSVDPYDSSERRLGPDAAGRYEVPGWSWGPMDASEVDEIVPAEQPDGAPRCRSCGGPCLVFECMTPGCPLGPPLPAPPPAEPSIDAPAGFTWLRVPAEITPASHEVRVVCVAVAADRSMRAEGVDPGAWAEQRVADVLSEAGVVVVASIEHPDPDVVFYSEPEGSTLPAAWQ